MTVPQQQSHTLQLVVSDTLRLLQVSQLGEGEENLESLDGSVRVLQRSHVLHSRVQLLINTLLHFSDRCQLRFRLENEALHFCSRVHAHAADLAAVGVREARGDEHDRNEQHEEDEEPVVGDELDESGVETVVFESFESLEDRVCVEVDAHPLLVAVAVDAHLARSQQYCLICDVREGFSWGAPVARCTTAQRTAVLLLFAKTFLVAISSRTNTLVAAPC